MTFTTPASPFCRARLHRACAAVTATLAGVFQACPAHAAQTVEVREGDTAVVRIALRDQTRLRAWRGRIEDVIGDVFDAQKNPAGRIVVLKDEADGEVYVKPVAAPPARAADGSFTPGLNAQPVKLDIKTDAGTVGVLLLPADIVGDTVTLKVTGGAPRTMDRGTGAKRGAAEGSALPGAQANGQALPRLRRIKALTLAMASAGQTGRTAEQVLPGGGQALGLWADVRFVLRARLEAGDLVGERYELTNAGTDRMVIDERELYRPGVVAVSLKQLALEPGQTTAVWVVREAGGMDTGTGAGAGAGSGNGID